jgi:hypothetical protein
MAFWNSLRTTLIDPLLSLRLWLLQVVGNALLLAVFAWFLHIGDGYNWQIALSAFLALAMTAALLTLHGGTMNHALDVARARNGGEPAELAAGLLRAVKHLLPLLPWVLVFYFIESRIDRLEDYQYSFPGWLRSEFPAWLRRLISEHGIDRTYMLGVSFLRWTLVPAVMLPLGLLCADMGFRGMVSFRLWWRMVRNLRWWIVLLLTGVLAVYCISGLMEWKLNPLTASLGAEKIWLGSRLLTGYLLAIAAWLAACAALAEDRRKADEDAAGSAAKVPEPAPVPVASAKA